MTDEPSGIASRTGWANPWLLSVAAISVYALSLSGDWLGYDDDWLVRDNPLLADGGLSTVPRILFGFDRDTRLILGAEYLPVRDLVTWLFRGVLGLGPGFLRTLQLAVYVGAMALFLRWAQPLGRSFVLAVWLFAVHPVHAESVAWLAGLKDVLALLFLAAALMAYAGWLGSKRWWIPCLVGLACLSKGAAVIAPALLWGHDYLASRRPDWRTLGASSALAVAITALHVWVGARVGMFAEPLGATFLERSLTAATILARYLGLSLLVHPSSLFYEVDATGPTAVSIACVLLLLGLATGCFLGHRRGVRWPTFAFLVFVVGLLPVLQLAAPLQNRMADRYLLVALLGPMLAVSHALDGALGRVGEGLARVTRGGVVGIVGALGLMRALMFTDPVALFEEGTVRTVHNAAAPFMLAEAYVRVGRDDVAEAAYREAIARDGFTTERGRRAGNNLGLLLARHDRIDEAVELFTALVDRYPDHPRALHNLAVLEATRGDTEAAERHRAELARRFPRYRPGSDPQGPR